MTTHLKFEALPNTLRPGFISVRLWANGDQEMNCGLTVMRHEDFLALAFRPPTSELVATEVTVSEGTLDELVERIVGTSLTPA